MLDDRNSEWCQTSEDRALERHEILARRIGPAASLYTYTYAKAVISTEERARARRMHSPERRRLFVLAHATLRILVGRQLDIPPTELGFTNEPFGKPVLDRRHSDHDLHFSLSRSQGMALVALSRQPIGVDIEAVRDIPRMDDIIACEFDPDENKRLAVRPASDRTIAFLEYWTAKEAGLKGLGLGLSAPPSSARVILDNDGEVAGVDLDLASHGAGIWSITRLPVGPRHVAAVAVPGRIDQDRQATLNIC